ncbi:zinc-dependent alcohol dehydrogenase family protein [Bdellovibrio svalbardensis]|uniref:Zinc-dependent alcohol dehydrogenase family protein n=1 Tax=Bdellovibrio svalbardensis TaxID=2972972 RepID=A0ABT6DNG3_9BACT|nr:zinc-dependent alcohol dehydrogenase family protein [Bdellovibrio svalbardensis]MDG0818169.1 zinc-dependent alcohol dehydrogenase family protein [Bdellovibrio svalbardensis]
MKALLLHHQAPIEEHPLVLEDWPIPKPQDDEILLKVDFCAICRTDLHIIEGDLALQRTPLIPGHQAIGTVVQLGSKCKSVSVGMTVGVAWLGSTCKTCEYCEAGKENLCVEPRFTGYHFQGGYAEYMTAKEDYVYVLPASTNKAQTTPLLCAGIIGYRALVRSGFSPGKHLGIFGFGSSAHVIAQLAIAQKARLSVVTRSTAHQNLAKDLGAQWVSDSTQGLPDLLDSAILFAPAGDLVPVALESLKRGGTLAVAGIHLSPIPLLDYEKHLFFEKDLRSVTANTRQDGQELLKAAHEVRIHPQTTIYEFEKANEALQDLKHDLILGTAVLKISK